jgi:hypothetical protein
MNPIKEKELIEKIVEAVPGIMKLQNGCRIQKGNIFTFVNMISSFYGRNSVTLLDDNGKFLYQYVADTKEIEEWIIIGRPITLEDVMIAIDRFCNDYFKEYSGEVLESWIWGNSLENQSEKLKDWLWEVICKQ